MRQKDDRQRQGGYGRQSRNNRGKPAAYQQPRLAEARRMKEQIDRRRSADKFENFAGFMKSLEQNQGRNKQIRESAMRKQANRPSLGKGHGQRRYGG